MKDTFETEANTVVVPFDFVVEHDALITELSFYIQRAAGTIKLLILKPVTVAATCQFDFIEEWESPDLAEITDGMPAWKKVN